MSASNIIFPLYLIEALMVYILFMHTYCGYVYLDTMHEDDSQ